MTLTLSRLFKFRYQSILNNAQQLPRAFQGNKTDAVWNNTFLSYIFNHTVSFNTDQKILIYVHLSTAVTMTVPFFTNASMNSLLIKSQT